LATNLVVKSMDSIVVSQVHCYQDLQKRAVWTSSKLCKLSLCSVDRSRSL